MLDEALDRVGCGLFQVLVAIVPCLMLALDAMLVQMLTVVRHLVAAELSTEGGWSQTEVEALVPTLTFVGMLVGAPVSGFVSDHHGRRAGVLMASGLLAAGLLMMATAPSATLFFLGDLVAGAGGGGLHVGQALIAEVVPTAWRDVSMALYGTCWTSGILLETVVFGCYPGAWRTVVAYTAVPAVFVVLVAWGALPDSPRFLLMSGQPEQLDAFLRQAARVNGQCEGSDGVPKGLGSFATYGATACRGPSLPSVEGMPPNRRRPTSRVVALLGSEMRSTTVRLWVLWCVTTAAYYTALLGTSPSSAAPSVASSPSPSPSLSERSSASSVIGPMLLLGFCEYPSYLIQYALGSSLGRRRGLTACYLATLVAGAVLFRCTGGTVHDDAHSPPFGVAASATFRLVAMVTFNLLWLYTPEAFPTTFRSTGCASCTCLSRLAGAASPYLVLLGRGPLAFVGALAFGAAAVAAMTFDRESAKQPLLDAAGSEELEP